MAETTAGGLSAFLDLFCLGKRIMKEGLSELLFHRTAGFEENGLIRKPIFSA